MKEYYRRRQAGKFLRWKREKGVWWMLSDPTIRLVLLWAGAPMYQLFKILVVSGSQQIELSSVNGSHLLWEVINPQKKDTPQ